LSWTLAEHRAYLGDEGRLSAYRRALAAVVQPGDVVLDLGTGTGVLGVLAAEAGAGRVYAVDATEMLGVAGAVVRANGLSDRITLVKGHSQAVELPERADVVVADQLGPFGIEAGVLAAYRDAVRRHLKPGGALIPSRIDLSLAPASSDEVWKEVTFWDEPTHGVDVTAIAPHARNSRYYTTSAPEDLLGEATIVAALDLAVHDNAPIRASLTWEVARAGTMHGLAGWFTAELSPGVSVSNSPLATPRLDRSHLFLPVAAPVQLALGDTVEASVHVVPPDGLARWTVVVRDGEGNKKARSVHSTLDLSVLSREDLARTRPDHMPMLGPSGEARRTLLTMMDGQTRLEELEDALWERHPEIFDSREAAAAFVGRMVAREAS
jgi:protein arginine N-methyltransferase 1